MKTIIGLVLLTVGIGLTAGFGAVLSPEFRRTTIKDAEVSFADAEVDERRDEYCDLRQKFKLPAADGCSGSDPLVPHASNLNTMDLRAAELTALKSSAEMVVLPVSQARTQYRMALRKSLKRSIERRELGTQGPQSRLDGWLGEGGLGFGIGLLLLVMGAWMARRAHAVDAEATDAGQDGVLDFGQLLDSVANSVEELHRDMTSTAQPNFSDLDGFKDRLEDVQKDAMARLCASGPRAQARYGIEGMAALFSPLSSAERKLNRAWAALVDRHWPEALVSVASAKHDLEGTQEALKQLV